MKDTELQKKVSKHNATVYAKNCIMTSILTLKDIENITVDNDVTDLLNDLKFILDKIEKGEK